ncbi:16S rRNA (guanine(527)-N(7))-methyltransferase RsmG [Naumannella sp. ID2617S]|uniref:Ribosomal RNA small subunit methyltransferase G n=1 Tax=Enemella dayhoffiae TaxID=2016507 RepID=A0A255HC71_9ACTN|nr:16S rRNA (guanine(527)-N(7))-methyltransferase RsmG [Enemella dayhoffiae]NNG20100.1 16S rRNA (guanine(527)-N(7))-methyltransferase RsmG [Naumannella sp. ID2617S]OYO25305.1 16S rRNA (guanine(527)-N(7))-methyltransferase RsmG [Enemella dayhoffiae]
MTQGSEPTSAAEPGSDAGVGAGAGAGDELRVAREVFGDRFELAERYRDLLAAEGIEWGLIGPREVDRLWSRHILNSAALTEVLPTGAEVADIGSGAGLPGIPLALARPDLGITLVEPLQRRVNFLNLAVDKLGITDRVGVIRGRAEDFGGSFDVVTCRAVGPLDRLLRWCVPLLSPTGALIALKGASAADEVRGVEKVLRKQGLRAELLSVRAHPAAEATTAVRVTRS